MQFMRRTLCPIYFGCVLFASSVQVNAQRAGENAVANAEDAFGASIGNDSIGLYSASDVRGFSALEAGNARIDGLYFDQKASVTGRIRAGSAIRVGLGAQSYAFPAPTGVIEYRLREAGERRVVSTVLGLDPNLGPYLEIDTLTPLHGADLGLAAGIGVQRDRRIDGSAADYISYGASLHWVPKPGLKIRAFFGRFDSVDDEAQPVIFAATSALPPEIERGEFYGQDWADSKGFTQNYGVTANWEMTQDWRVEAGVFNSTLGQGHAFSLLFNDTAPDGWGNPVVLARRDQKISSTSGELRLSRSFTEGPRSHAVRLSFRGRNVKADYGGTAAFPLGPSRTGVANQLAEPLLAYGPLSHDSIRHSSLGAVYEGRWRGRGEMSLGIQQVDYTKVVDIPGRPVSTGNDKPLLVNATAAIYLNERFALYSSFTEGLEESGIAPDNAANLGAVLPALRTRQVDGGIRFNFTPDLRLVAGMFEVEKPYFYIDARDRNFRQLGEVRHRGMELSLAGPLAPGLNVVAGVVLMQPQVTGEAVTDGRVGRKPVGQTGRRVQLSLNYQPPGLDAVLFDATLTHFGPRIANLTNTLETADQVVINAGLRYSFAWGRSPAVLRLQVVNITDQFVWQVNRSGGLQPNQGRTLTGTLAIDF